MKVIINYCLLAGLIWTMVSCQNDSKGNNQSNKSKGKTTEDRKGTVVPVDSIGLTYFRDLMGKYPSQIKLFEKPELASRLQKMMGPDFEWMKKNWETEVPIEISNGIAFTWGMQGHSGGDPGASICADINRNILYTAIRRDGQVKTFTEQKGPLPLQMEDWIKGD